MNTSNCPANYANDEWILLTTNPYNCGVHVTALYVLTIISFIGSALVLLLTVGRMGQVYLYKPQLSKSLWHISYLCSCGTNITQMIILSSFGVRHSWTFPLVGVWLGFLMTMSSSGAYMIIRAVPDAVKQFLSAQSKTGYFEKISSDCIIRTNLITCIVCTIGVTLCWSLAVTLTLSNNNLSVSIIFWKIGCALVGLFLAMVVSFAIRYIDMLVELMKSTSAENSPLLQIRKKLIAIKYYAVACGGIATLIWFVHAIILDFYWWIYLLHSFNSVGATTIILIMNSGAAKKQTPTETSSKVSSETHSNVNAISVSNASVLPNATQ